MFSILKETKWVFGITTAMVTFLSVLLVCCNASTSGNQQPRLVLLYATCTLNKNYLSPYNTNVSFTPNLEKFSQKSVVFKKHRTEAGQSGVAYASIFTGNQVMHHGIFFHPTKLMDSVYEITEAFGENGYETFFWNGHQMASLDLNYAQGTPQKKVVGFRKFLRAEDLSFKKILNRLASDKKYKAFVMTNFTVTHGPYHSFNLERFCMDYPDECSLLTAMKKVEFDKYVKLYRQNAIFFNYNFPQAINSLLLIPNDIAKLSSVVDLLYKTNVNFLDKLFGDLIDEIDAFGMLNESLIVFTADHGESLYRENIPFKWCHGFSLQADVLDVPLIIRSTNSTINPGIANFVTRSIDVFPTIAGLCGLQIPKEETIEGYDLSKVLMGSSREPSLLAYSHSGMVPEITFQKFHKIEYRYLTKFYPKTDMELTWVAIREKDAVWKYKNLDGLSFGFQAFDLQNDPLESVNIFNPDNPHHQEMATKLKRYKNDLVQKEHYWRKQRRNEEMKLPDSEAIQKLRSLGYIK